MRYLFVLLVLTGCAIPERPQYDAAQAQEAYRRQVLGQCLGYGFQPGSPEFRQCVMQVDMANQAQENQTRAVILQQILQQQSQDRPRCASLPPYIAGVERARGNCR